MCLHARGVYTRAARGSKDIPYTGGFKLDPRAGDKEALRDVRGTLMGIFIGRKRKQKSGNLQGPDDGENGGSGTGSCLLTLLDPAFILLPFAHVLLFPCLFSV